MTEYIVELLVLTLILLETLITFSKFKIAWLLPTVLGLMFNILINFVTFVDRVGSSKDLVRRTEDRVLMFKFIRLYWRDIVTH
jgi:hypothetical protein